MELSGLPGKLWDIVGRVQGRGKVELRIPGGHGLTKEDCDEGAWDSSTQSFAGKWKRGKWIFRSKDFKPGDVETKQVRFL